MKSYTDISQSKKLAEILPLESADMHYERAYFEGKQSDWFVKLGSPITSDDIIPCWSLAVLLEVIPNSSLHNTFTGWRCDSYNEFTPELGETKSNPIDTCFEMILKIYKQKLL